MTTCLNEAIPLKRLNILGVGIHALSLHQALSLTTSLLDAGGHGYICVTGVHGIIEAQDDLAFRDILNGSFLTVPDGMPTVWIGRLQGHGEMGRVYGPDFMRELLSLSQRQGYRHFLYGGKPGVVERLASSLRRRFPDINIVGTYTPPFRTLTTQEEQDVYDRIRATRPHVLWCGLSTPKQERFMAQYSDRLPVQLMVGVGAAFDIHAGLLRDAPDWVKRIGCQWLHRMLQEPRRLAGRYLRNNPRFLYLLFLQLVGVRKYGSPAAT